MSSETTNSQHPTVTGPAPLWTDVIDDTDTPAWMDPERKWKRPTNPDPSKEWDAEYATDGIYDADEAQAAREAGVW